MVLLNHLMCPLWGVVDTIKGAVSRSGRNSLRQPPPPLPLCHNFVGALPPCFFRRLIYGVAEKQARRRGL